MVNTGPDSKTDAPRQWGRRDVAALLTGRNALTELSVDDALKIVAKMELRRVKAGTVLIQEGASDTGSMFLILSGEMSVVSEALRKAESVILHVLGSGHIVGEMGLLDGEPRSATCTAVSDCDVAQLKRDALSNLLTTEPIAVNNLFASLLQRLSARMRSTSKKMRAMEQANRALEAQVAGLQLALNGQRAGAPQASATAPSTQQISSTAPGPNSSWSGVFSDSFIPV